MWTSWFCLAAFNYDDFVVCINICWLLCFEVESLFVLLQSFASFSVLSNVKILRLYVANMLFSQIFVDVNIPFKIENTIMLQSASCSTLRSPINSYSTHIPIHHVITVIPARAYYRDPYGILGIVVVSVCFRILTKNPWGVVIVFAILCWTLWLGVCRVNIIVGPFRCDSLTDWASYIFVHAAKKQFDRHRRIGASFGRNIEIFFK